MAYIVVERSVVCRVCSVCVVCRMSCACACACACYLEYELDGRKCVEEGAQFGMLAGMDAADRMRKVYLGHERLIVFLFVNSNRKFPPSARHDTR